MSWLTDPRRPVERAVLATAAICCALLVLPGTTATSMYFNDLLIFLDGAYRVVHGQVPNRDFHTALGPLAFYIPGLGYWLTGRLGMAMPVGMAALVLLTAPIMIHVLRTRLRPLIAVPTAVFLILHLATPMNTGETVANISFAMFYNRIGWVLLGLLLVMHLRPEAPMRRQIPLDTLAATVLTLILVYTKVTYGVVAIGFLLLTLLQPVQRRWAAGALAACLAGALLIELFWGGSRSHIEDLLVATNVSGVTETETYLRSLLETSGEYVLFLALAGLALWQRPRVPDLLFYGFCICAGFALLNQNFQVAGVVTLLTGGVVAAEILARCRRPGMSRIADAARRGAPLAAILLMLPIGVASAGALALHATMATIGAGIALDTPNGKDLRVVRTLNEGQFQFYREYADTLASGATILGALATPASRVLTMDFVSPFPSLVGLAPPDGGTAWMHDGRNFDEEFHFPPEELLGGVDAVMIPMRPVARSTTEMMEDIYGAYLERHFRLTTSTGLWRVYQRREPSAAEPGTVS